MPSDGGGRINEVTVAGPKYWVENVAQLRAVLRQAAGAPASRVVPDLSAKPTGETAVIVDPGYWASQEEALREALRDASAIAGAPRREHAAGAGGASQTRLTLSVEEVAQVLGISRAGAYEAVQRGEIPHIRIGRRILVPRSALDRLLETARAESSE